MRCLRSLLAIIGVVLFSATLIAQSPQNTPRITTRIDENALVTLPGNTHPFARAEYDRGPVDPGLRMGDLHLVLRRSPSQQKAFDDFVAGQYDSSSPNFHHWLTPDEIGTSFGPSLADIETISAWLRSHGFSIDEVSRDRMSIRFSGTASQVESAFHAPIHNLAVKNQPHIANMSDPQIPAALAPVVFGVKALHNFFPHPLSRIGSEVRQNPDTGKWERITPSDNAGAGSAVTGTPGKGIRPQFGITIGTGSDAFQVEDVAPYDWATIYNVLPLWNASTPIDGTGQKIAVAGTSNINLSDVATFRSKFGLPAKVPQVVITNGTDPGTCGTTALASCNKDQVENTLDVEWTGAVAKNAQIILITSGAPTTSTDPLTLSAQYIIDHSVAPVMSVSYGLCELGLGTAGNTAWANMWRTAAAAGISVFVSTGDSGSPACDQGGDANGTPYVAEFGLSVSGIASTPDNTAVGGTDLNWGSTAAPYWNSSNNATNGSSAKGYMPEVPWNDSCTSPQIWPALQNLATEIKNAGLGSPTNPTDADTSCNFVADWYPVVINAGGPDISFLLDTVGAGGGISGCTTYDGGDPTACTGGYAQPAWQTGVVGIPSGGKRAIPDVSFFASNGFLGSAYLICVTSAGSTCTYPTTSANGLASFLEIGGTSASTPAMAGVMALINQKLGSPQGNAAPEMYKLASKQTYANCNSNSVTNSSSCYFNDTTSGTIAMPCDNGLTSSSNAVGVLTGYAATAAYDAATGLGSMNVANVVNAWTAFVGTGTSTVTVSPNPTTIARTSPLTVGVTIKGSASLGNPSGTVKLSGGGYTSADQDVAVSGTDSATASFSIPAKSLTIGSDTLTVTYSGDDVYAGKTGTATVTVNGLTPTVTVVPSLSTLNSSTALDVTATVAGTGGTPTGTATISGGGYNSGAQPLDSTGKFVFHIPAFSFTSGGVVTLTLSYSGDVDYSSASKTATVNITVSTFTLQATDVTMAAGATTGNASTVTVTPSASYTGTVTLTAAVTAAPAGAVSAPTLTGSSVAITNAPNTGTVSVATIAASARGVTHAGLVWFHAAGGTALAAFLCFFLPFGSRRGRRILSGMLIIVAATFTVAGCGGGGGGGGGTQKTTPSVTVSPSKSSFAATDAISVAVSVSGGTTAATGTVTLSGGGFTSSATTVASGAATIAIPANSFTTTGPVTLTATYSGDTNFNSANGTASVIVNKPATTAGAYTITVTGTGSDAAHTTAHATFTLTVQ
jgi:subtilase family serine protease